MEFNLIATHMPGYYARRDAARELEALDSGLRVVWRWQNVIYATVEDPDEVARRARERLPKSTVILRIIPVHAVTSPRVRDIREAVHKLLARAPPGSFAIRIDGHPEDDSGQLMHRRDAAVYIAEGLERPVNLSSPDVLVYVKVTRFRRGYRAAVYVGPPSGIYSSVRRG